MEVGVCCLHGIFVFHFMLSWLEKSCLLSAQSASESVAHNEYHWKAENHENIFIMFIHPETNVGVCYYTLFIFGDVLRAPSFWACSCICLVSSMRRIRWVNIFDIRCQRSGSLLNVQKMWYRRDFSSQTQHIKHTFWKHEWIIFSIAVIGTSSSLGALSIKTTVTNWLTVNNMMSYNFVVFFLCFKFKYSGTQI